MLAIKKALVKILLLAGYPVIIVFGCLFALLMWPLFIFVPVEQLVGKDFFE